MVVTVSLLAAFTVRPAAAAPKNEKITESQALDLQKKFEAAQMAGDTKTVASLMTDNATFVHGSMRVQNKTDFVAGIGKGPSGIDRPDEKVVLFNDGTGAIVMGPATISFAAPASAGAGVPPRQLHLYMATVWVHTGAGWQVLVSQGTEAPPAAPGAPAGR